MCERKHLSREYKKLIKEVSTKMDVSKFCSNAMGGLPRHGFESITVIVVQSADICKILLWVYNSLQGGCASAGDHWKDVCVCWSVYLCVCACVHFATVRTFD